MCDITKGRGFKCANEIGGYNALYFIKTADMDLVTFKSDGSISELSTALTSAKIDAFKYVVVGATNLDDDSIQNETTGTTFNTTAGTVTLLTSSAEDSQQLLNAQKGLFSIVAETRSGKSILIGWNRSVRMSSLKALRGSAEGDLVGYTFDIDCKTDRLSPFIDGAVKNDPFNGLDTDNVNIVTS